MADSDMNAPAASSDAAQRAFEAYTAERGVWPRLTHEEIFKAGWNAAVRKLQAAADKLDGTFKGFQWDSGAGSSGYDQACRDLGKAAAKLLTVVPAPTEQTTVQPPAKPTAEQGPQEEDLEEPEHTESALIEAAYQGQTDEVRRLLDNGANVHANANEALRGAADNGHTAIVRLLLDHGADIHALADSALCDATRNGHTETMRLLLDRGADIHANGDFVLRWAADCDCSPGTLALLEAHLAAIAKAPMPPLPTAPKGAAGESIKR